MDRLRHGIENMVISGWLLLVPLSVFALPPPTCVSLGKLGAELRDIHKNTLGVALDRDLFPPKHIMRHLTTPADPGNGEELTIHVVLYQNEISLYKQVTQDGLPVGKLNPSSLSFRIPAPVAEAGVSQIVRLINHPKEPLAIALAFGSEIWLMNALTGNILQRFTTGGAPVHSVLLTTDYLVAGIPGELRFFDVLDPEGDSTPIPSMASYPTPEGTAHLLHLSRYEVFRQMDDPVTHEVTDPDEPLLVTAGAVHMQFHSLILAAAGDTLYFIGFPTAHGFVTFPPLKFSAPITQLMVADFKHIPTLENDEHEILIVRTERPGMSRLHTAIHFKHLDHRDQGTPLVSSQKLPQQGLLPHTLLITYNKAPEDSARGEDEGEANPFLSGEVDDDAPEPYRTALLVATPDYSQGLLFDMHAGKLGSPVDPATIDVMQVVRYLDPGNLFELDH